MNPARYLRVEGVEGKHYAYLELGQLLAQRSILGQAQAVGVHGHPADLRA